MVAGELIALGELNLASRVYYDRTVEYFASGKVSQSNAPHLVAAKQSRARRKLSSNGCTMLCALSPEDWDILLTYASYFEINALDGNLAVLPQTTGLVFPGMLSLLENFQAQGAWFESLSGDARQRVISAVDRVLDPEARQELLASYGPAYLETAQRPPTGTALPAALEKAYTLFENGLKKGVAPAIFDIYRLIEGSGRLKNLDNVRELYMPCNRCCRRSRRRRSAMNGPRLRTAYLSPLCMWNASTPRMSAVSGFWSKDSLGHPRPECILPNPLVSSNGYVEIIIPLKSDTLTSLLSVLRSHHRQSYLHCLRPFLLNKTYNMQRTTNTIIDDFDIASSEQGGAFINITGIEGVDTPINPTPVSTTLLPSELDSLVINGGDFLGSHFSCNNIVINGGTFEDSTLVGDGCSVNGAQFITVNGPKIVYSYFGGKKYFTHL
ncbi:hypothetical protein BDN70DRAFT_934636 [Pholiota conissans]|uniref:Uncharacterized protein n=1 Tax=Pholiota conissans TaxID=109636 RepID=A0A9P5YW85_9AGAR|nr:hypothetical protein BDN70DRAFT_934636 [Pholiota conissans]